MQLLLVDGESRAVPTLRRILTRTGHVVLNTTSHDEARLLAREFECDAIILGCAAVAGNALELIAELKAAQTVRPVIVVAEAAPQASVCRYLQHGADDVVARASPQLAVARIIAAARRGHGHAQSQLCVGGLQLNLGTGSCQAGDRTVRLTPMEYRLVEALALRRGQMVTRTRLLGLLYGAQGEPFPKSIDVFVHNIRAKIGAALAVNPLETWGKAFVLRDTPSVELAA